MDLIIDRYINQALAKIEPLNQPLTPEKLYLATAFIRYLSDLIYNGVPIVGKLHQEFKKKYPNPKDYEKVKSEYPSPDGLALTHTLLSRFFRKEFFDESEGGYRPNWQELTRAIKNNDWSMLTTAARIYDSVQKALLNKPKINYKGEKMSFSQAIDQAVQGRDEKFIKEHFDIFFNSIENELFISMIPLLKNLLWYPQIDQESKDGIWSNLDNLVYYLVEPEEIIANNQ